MCSNKIGMMLQKKIKLAKNYQNCKKKNNGGIVNWKN